MSSLLERWRLKREIVLSRKAIRETLDKGKVTSGQIDYLDKDPKQEALF